MYNLYSVPANFFVVTDIIFLSLVCQVFQRQHWRFPKMFKNLQRRPKSSAICIKQWMHAKTALTFPVPVPGRVSLNMTSLPVLSI